MEDYLELHALNPYMTELSQGASAIRKMDKIARELAKQYGDDAIHNFSLGNPRVLPPEEYNQIMKETLDDKSFFYRMVMPQILEIKKEEKQLQNYLLRYKK